MWSVNAVESKYLSLPNYNTTLFLLDVLVIEPKLLHEILPDLKAKHTRSVVSSGVAANF